MSRYVKLSIALLLSSLFIASCSSSPQSLVPDEDRAQAQKIKAQKAQDELAAEISKLK